MTNRRRTASTARHGLALSTMAATIPAAVMTTLAHRMPMLLAAFGDKGSKQNPELTRMVSEKVQAAGLASQGLGAMAIAGQQALAVYAMEQVTSNLTLSTRLATAAPASWQQHLQTHGRQTSNRLGSLSERLVEIGSRGLTASLKPAHSRVLANAKRLGGKKRAP